MMSRKKICGELFKLNLVIGGIMVIMLSIAFFKIDLFNVLFSCGFEII